ncbi:MAG: hypothetical protein NTX24_00750 [Candidatus Pacearchaeota archaeon]|nr:hypothetical protein [Candidatus Pacearchaeota archaeon]
MSKSSAETWVKVIAILGYISAVALAIVGILMLVGKSILGSIPQFSTMLGGSIGAIFVVAAIITIVIGIFEFIVALNLAKHHNWARIVMIVLAAIGFIGSLASIVSSPVMAIIDLVINGGIFYLLAIDKDIAALFK